ncbi:hypothetical protein [Sphingorhabdus sp. SMR4y]|uniref:hypothetical protein n=1 Tax=Sphingorhabdus sp. SMR4y TaxID=2584094 RepID=UPI000B5CC4EE|nr:hypothetical protein [Sphingorhabdus sp. SMR4y]ASK89909.1 hypothetical protein SPHFLASMR4Y_03180 [Sphingorhabdus sp. SMR4y]
MKTFLLVATAALSFSAAQAFAQEAAPGEAVAPVAEPAPAAVAPIPELVTQNAILRAGTPITLRLMEEVTTKKKMARVGQRVRMEVAAPVYVNDVVVIPAGSPAEAELTSVRNKGMWGKSGKLEARALFARVNGRQIRLTGAFDDKGVTGTAGVVGAIALVPIAGFFMTGTSAVFPMGGEVPAFIDEDVELAIQAKKPAPLTVETPGAPLAIEADAAETSVAAPE